MGMKLPFDRGRKEFVKFFTKSRFLASRKESHPVRMIIVGWRKEPSRIGADQLVVGQQEFRQKQVAVGLIKSPAGVAAINFVFVVVVKAVISPGTGFRKTVGIALSGFVEDHQLGRPGWLSGLPEIAPKAGFLHIISPSVVEISARLGFNLSFPDFRRWLGTHVANLGRATRAGAEKQNWKDDEEQEAH